jgi:Uma2 family endonuclease
MGVRLANAIAGHADQHNLGVVLGADCGFRLESDPDTVRAPDAALVTRARIAAAGVPTGYWQGPPDLAVEVLSPSDSRAELRAKIAEYLRLGVQEVWFVEPVEHRLTIYGRPGVPQVLSELDTLDGGDLLPGFSYPLSRLFSFDS